MTPEDSQRSLPAIVVVRFSLIPVGFQKAEWILVKGATERERRGEK